MNHLKYKEFSAAEAGQLSHLSFVAGGNLRKSANNTRNRLRNKESKIYQQNFIIKLKNFCIDLQAKKFDQQTFLYLSQNINLHKKPVDPIDYSLQYNATHHRQQRLQLFIQNNVSFKYLKMYYDNRDLIV